LEELMGYNGEKGGIPRVVQDSIQFLRNSGILSVIVQSFFLRLSLGLEEEGLFRRSPSSAMLRAAKSAYDRGKYFFTCLLPHPSNFIPAGNIVSLDKFGDPFLAAVLIKKYLRDLPESIIPEKLYPIIRRCPQPISNPSNMNAVIYIRDVLLPELVPCAYILLSNVLRECFVFILTLYQVSTNE